MKQLSFIIATIMLASSCKSAKESIQVITPLYNTKWSLKKIYTNNIEEAVNTKAFIRFDKEKSSAGGNGSCNSFGSNATISANEVSFKNIFSTKMYCEQVQEVENKYLGHLGKITRYEIKGKNLLLYNDKELMLEFSVEKEKKSAE